MVRQKHINFDPAKADFVTTEEDCLFSLVMHSVSDNTRYQYWSRLNTLCRYLRARRNLAEDAQIEPISCSRAEFLGFLKSWSDQGMGDPEPTRSALLLWQRAWGIGKPFTEETAVIAACKGAAGHPGPDKLVLDEDSQEQYEVFLMRADTEQLGGCRTCGMDLEDPRDRELLVHASRFMKQVPIRLHNLREFESTDMLYETGEVFVKHMKTCKGGPGYAPFDLVAQDIVRSVISCGRGRFRTFLFPTCIQKHLTASLASAGVFYGWEEGLVHTGYCLRHTGMRNRKKNVTTAVTDVLLASMSASSAGNVRHYARDNAKRRKQK